MRTPQLLLTFLLSLLTLHALAQNAPDSTSLLKDLTVNIHGTVRGKFEYQPDQDNARFEVRNARVSLTGNITPNVGYKAEIDLSDEGSIKMLDAYGRIIGTRHPWNLTIGQMRVPFTIDTHRSPHQQYFANRSFLAKQVGNVRDVGISFQFKTRTQNPLTIQAGMFNGSGLTNQKNYWTRHFNYTAKFTLNANDYTYVLSYQKTHPDIVDIHMVNFGLFRHTSNFHAEIEYLLKFYAHDAFSPVNTFDVFACYNIHTPRLRTIKKISPLARWDFMSDHSNGTADDNGELIINDYMRHRLTLGFTMSLSTPFTADVRCNYEQYFYGDDAIIGTSDHNKLVVELMVHF